MTLSYTNQGTQLMAPPPPAYPVNQYVQQAPQWSMQPPPYAAPAPAPYYYNYPQQPVQNGGPSLSAVKIDINGASMDTGGNGRVGQPMPFYPGRAQAMPMPTYQPYMPVCPPPVYQQPLPPVQPQPIPMPAPAPVINQQPAPMPAQPQPVPVINQQPAPMPVPVVPPPPNMVNQQNYGQPVPPPAAIDQTQVTQQPQQVQQAQPTQQAEQPQAPQVDPIVQPLVSALAVINPAPGQTPSREDQSLAIQTVAQYAHTAEAADQMLKEQPENAEAISAKQKVDQHIKPLIIEENVFKGLINLATQDTSQLPEAEKQKADENKIISMWTLSRLQNMFRKEMNAELAKRAGTEVPPMPVSEIPGAADIVNVIKSDPNPEVRESAIYALDEISDPKNEKDVELMKTVLQIAKEQDADEGVRVVANNAGLEFLQKAGLSKREMKKAGFKKEMAMPEK